MIKPTLRMTRGDNKEIPFIVYDENDARLDLDEVVSITFSVKAKRSDVDPIIMKDLSDGIVILNANEGTAKIVLLPEDTSGIEGTRRGLLWDIQVVNNANEVYTVLEGIITVFADITQG